MPRPDEQSGADDAGDGKHCDVTRLEALRQLAIRILGARANHWFYSPVIDIQAY
jgi:hypothetical protein